MSILNDVYGRSLAENEKNLHFWEDYLQNLKSLDFSVFADRLKVPALVPIGSRIFFRGDLKHTNEVTVSLGADYFAKCSLKQAEELKQHRIKDAQSKIEIFRKEKQYLENQMSYKKNVYDNKSQEIIEVYIEEEDKAWRETHRKNVRKYKQSEKKKTESKDEVNDEELWNRLEELELQEELENVLHNIKENTETSDDSLIIKGEDFGKQKENKIHGVQYSENKEKPQEETEEKVSKEEFKEIITPIQRHKLDLLQQVIDKQNDLEQKLLELKNRERGQSKTQQDLISKLDEMEQLDELEDEMDRLDDILENEDIVVCEEDSKLPSTKLKRSVSFADEDNSDTIQLTFTHSNIEPCKEPYDAVKGIVKPSDIYEACSDLFVETASILKKSKYEDNEAFIERPKISKKTKTVQFDDELNSTENKTIVINDVVEKVQQNNTLQSEDRPVSLFKKRRQQQKSFVNKI